MSRKRKILPPEKRKEELLEAAAGVFSEKGYRTASISDIIERAGVARGTFYHYFESKSDVFLELIESYFSSFAGILEENHRRLVEAQDNNANPLEAWRVNVLAVFEFHSENPELTALVYREAMGLDENFSTRVDELSALARKRLAEEFRIMEKMGLMVPCDIELVTTIVSGAAVNIIREYILGGEECDLATLADELVRNQARALAPSPKVVDMLLGAGAGPVDAKSARRAGDG